MTHSFNVENFCAADINFNTLTPTRVALSVEQKAEDGSIAGELPIKLATETVECYWNTKATYGTSLSMKLANGGNYQRSFIQVMKEIEATVKGYITSMNWDEKDWTVKTNLKDGCKIYPRVIRETQASRGTYIHHTDQKEEVPLEHGEFWCKALLEFSWVYLNRPKKTASVMIHVVEMSLQVRPKAEEKRERIPTIY